MAERGGYFLIPLEAQHADVCVAKGGQIVRIVRARPGVDTRRDRLRIESGAQPCLMVTCCGLHHVFQVEVPSVASVTLCFKPALDYSQRLDRGLVALIRDPAATWSRPVLPLAEENILSRTEILLTSVHYFGTVVFSSHIALGPPSGSEQLVNNRE